MSSSFVYTGNPARIQFAAPSAGVGLYDFAKGLGAPMRLSDLGFAEADIGRVVELATRNPYHNPHATSLDGIMTLIRRASDGTRPD